MSGAIYLRAENLGMQICDFKSAMFACNMCSDCVKVCTAMLVENSNKEPQGA